jgi:hypothetical protein
MATWNESSETGFDGNREVDHTYNLVIKAAGDRCEWASSTSVRTPAIAVMSSSLAARR